MERFSELARVRRSMRKFTDAAVGEEELRSILRAALMAPSSKGMHSSEFLVVDSKELLSSLSGCKAEGGSFLCEAPVAVVVLGDPTVSDAWIEDASVASTMMMLQAEDIGLGSCWVQVRGRQDARGDDAEANVRLALGVPDGLRVLCIVALGHKGMERKPQREDRLLWDKVWRCGI